jgi:hypothetical protein
MLKFWFSLPITLVVLLEIKTGTFEKLKNN